MEFALFVILTGILFVRPAEIFSGLAGLPIYNYVMVACLVANAPQIAFLWQRDQLQRRPIAICVLGMWGAVLATHLIRLDLWSARTDSVALAKVLIFFFLVLATVNTRQRLQHYLYWITLFTVFLTLLAVGHYHGYIELETLKMLKHGVGTSETGELLAVDRLQATGIFQDPNDLSMILVVAMCICAMGILDRFGGATRFLWLVPFVFLGYALTLTHSRGGFLAMMIAGVSLLYSRYGLRKAILALCLFLPLVGALFGGRQTDIAGGLSGGTGESRVELWSEGIQALRSSPLIGIGYRGYVGVAGQVAHNSYIHVIVELGILGGSVFLGAFWLCARGMWDLGSQRRWMTMVTGSPRLGNMQPFLIAIMAGYMASMLSLSRTYVIPTYLILGIMAAYQSIAANCGVPARVQLNGRELARILGVTLAYLVLTYVYIRVGFR